MEIRLFRYQYYRRIIVTQQAMLLMKVCAMDGKGDEMWTIIGPCSLYPVGNDVSRWQFVRRLYLTQSVTNTPMYADKMDIRLLYTYM